MTDDIDTKKTESKSHRKAIIFTLLGLALLLVVFGIGYFQLLKVNTSLAGMVTGLQSNVSKSQDDLSAVQKNVNDMQETEQKNAGLAAQQEKQMAEWRAAQNGDLNKWHLVEAQYLVKMADDNLQFNANTTIALALLERADQELASITDGSAASIRQAIQQNITTLKALTQIDTDGIYTQLMNIDKQIDQLPLPENPLQPDAALAVVNNPDESWWQNAMARMSAAMHKIVVIRNVGENVAPVVTPDEKAYLYQNLHAQLQSAVWGLLHRDNNVFQSSLERMQSWIKLYFVQDADATKNTLQAIDDLSKSNVQAPSANLDDTLNLFTNAQNTQPVAAPTPAPEQPATPQTPETTTPAQ